MERFPVLSETFVAAQAAALVQNGIDVTIFATRLEPAGLSHASVTTAGLIDRTHFAESRALHRLADRLGRPHRFCEGLRARAVAANDSDPVPFDIILCQFGHNGNRALEAVRRRQLKGPIWTIFHGYDLSLGVEPGRHPYADLFQRGAKFLPISDFWAKRLKEMGCPPERIAVHRVGVDCDAIAYHERPAATVPRLLTVCRLVEKKGVEFALKALAAVRQLAPAMDWHYSIIGDGPLRDQLESMATDLGIADRTRFYGSLPHVEVRAHLDRADIFLLPSVTASNGDMEGIPVALMEAMAAGVTVASSTHSGIPELVEHQSSGLLAPERDVPALAQNLQALLSDHALRVGLARKARAKVLRDFNNAVLDRDLVAMLRASADTAPPKG